MQSLFFRERKKTSGIILAALTFFSFLTRLLFLWRPKEVVFDETHFGKFFEGYLSHRYFFDIHPPLGKLILALGGWIAGIGNGYTFSGIGTPYPSNAYIIVRLLPAISGAMLIPVIYLLTYEISKSKGAASLAAFLCLFDNALIAQSRFILIDSFMLIFGFAGLYLYLRAIRGGGIFYMIISGILLAMAASVKWTGLGFLGLVWLHYLWDTKTKGIASAFLSYVLLPIGVYILIFAIHFSLLTKSGPGDAFMSREFQKGLEGTRITEEMKTLSFTSKFLELNRRMFEVNKGISSHPYSSRWYTWPFMIRPIFYWSKDTGNGDTARIYFIGNPFVWWLSTIGIICFISKRLWRSDKMRKETFPFLVPGYLINFLPFIFIGRVMFLYHYLTALVFAIIMTSIFLEDILKTMPLWTKYALMGLVISGFIFFSPLTYGIALSQKAWGLRVWMPTWI